VISVTTKIKSLSQAVKKESTNCCYQGYRTDIMDIRAAITLLGNRWSLTPRIKVCSRSIYYESRKGQDRLKRLQSEFNTALQTFSVTHDQLLKHKHTLDTLHAAQKKMLDYDKKLRRDQIDRDVARYTSSKY